MKTDNRRLSDRIFCAVTAFVMIVSLLVASGLFVPQVSADETAVQTGQLEVTNFKLWVNNSELKNGATVKDGDKVQLEIDWRIKNNEGLLDYSTSVDTRGISLSPLGSGDVYSEGLLIGTYEFEGDIFTIHLNEENTKDKSNIGGGARFDGVIDLDKDKTLDDGSDQIIGVDDVDFEVKYDTRNYGNVTVNKTKSGDIYYENGGYYQNFNIAVTATGKVKEIELQDYAVYNSNPGFSPTEPPLSFVDISATPQDGVEIDTELNVKTGLATKLIITLPDNATRNDTKTYNISYKAKFSQEYVDNCMTKGVEVRNTSRATYTNSKGEPKSAQSQQDVTPKKPSLKKTVAQTGNNFVDNANPSPLLQYSLTVDLGPKGLSMTQEEMAQIIIHDELLSPVNNITWFINVYNGSFDSGNVTSKKTEDNMQLLIWDIPLSNFKKQDDGTYLFQYSVPFYPVFEKSFNPTGGMIINNTADVTLFDEPLTSTATYDLNDYYYRPIMEKKVGTINYNNGTKYEGTTNANGTHKLPNPKTKTFTAKVDFQELSQLANSSYFNYVVLDAKLSDNVHINCNCKTHRTDLCRECPFCSSIKLSAVVKSSQIGKDEYAYDCYSAMGLQNSPMVDNGHNMALFPKQAITINGKSEYSVPISTSDDTFTMDFVWCFINGLVPSYGGFANDFYISFDVEVDEEAVKEEKDITCDFTLSYASRDGEGKDAEKKWTQTAHYAQTIPWEISFDLSKLRNNNYFTHLSNWNKLIISDQLTDSDGQIRFNHHFNCTCKEHSYTSCLDCEFCRGDNFEIIFETPATNTAQYKYSFKPYELCMYGCANKMGWSFDKDALKINEYGWSLDFQCLIDKNKTGSGNGYGNWSMLLNGYPRITIRYNTMIDDNVDVSKQTFYNVGTLNGKVMDYEWTESGLTSKDDLHKSDNNWASISGDEVKQPDVPDWNMHKSGHSSGASNLYWRLSVPLYDELNDTFFANVGDEIVITDTLPEHLSYKYNYGLRTYVSDTFKLSSYSQYGSNYPANVSVNNREITVSFKVTEEMLNLAKDRAIYHRNSYPSYNRWYSGNYIEIYTASDEDYLYSQSGSKVTFTNTAQMTVNGKPYEPVTANGTVNKPQLISKSGTSAQSGGDILANYKVEINKPAQDLIPDSDTLTLTDTIAKDLIIQEDSFKLYKDSIAEENLIDGLELVSYDKETGKAIITVPDGMHLWMTYTAKLNYDPSNKNWNSSSRRNEIKIEGENLYNNTGSTYTYFSSYQIRVWAYEMEGDISIYKYWNNNGEKTALPGAEFALYSVYDNNGHQYTEDDEEYIMRENIKITDESGKITVDNLPLDRIYKLVETNAPDGYLSGEDYYFMLQGHYGVEVPEFLADVTVYEFESGDIISYENVKYVTVEGTKTWVGDGSFTTEYRPEDIELSLYRSIDGKEEEEVELEDITWDKTTDADNWKYTIDKLPAYDKDGNEYTYRIEETEVTGYTADYSDNDIINTFETTTVSGTKTWVGDNANVRPESVTLELYADGSKVEYEYDVEWSETADTDVWSYSIADLPKYTTLGEEITYTVVETNVAEGYTASYDETKLNITNSYQVPLTEVSGTKEWKGDEETKETVRPNDVEVILLANGEPAEFDYTVEWTGKDTDVWSYTINNIPTRDEEGNLITYTVKEENVPLGYADAVYGFDIVNTFAMDKTNVEGTKTWVGDSSETRPEDIAIKLLANGEELENAVPVWSDKDTEKWSYVFENLDKYNYEKNEDGTIARTEIVYTVEEEVPEKYTVMYSENTLDITNTRITEVEISKVEISGGEELAGATLTVKDKDGNIVETWVTEGETHIIKGLVAGETYILIEESAPEGYQIAESIEFIVNSDGTVTKVQMIDEPIVPEDSSSEEDSSSSEDSSMPEDSSSESSSTSESTSSSSSATSSTTTSSTTTSSKPSTSSNTPSTSTPTVSTPSTDKSPSTGLVQNGAFAVAAISGALLIVASKKKDRN